MKRWGKRRLCLLAVLLLGIAGCDGALEDTGEAVYDSQVSAEEEDEIIGIDEDAWNIFEAAREKSNAWVNREETVLIYTIQMVGDERTEETIDLWVRFTGLGSEEAAFWATGSVMAGGQKMDMSWYYTDGTFYTVNGSSLTGQEAPYAEASSGVDVLASFLTELTREKITAIGQTTNADETTVISFSFSGMINEMDTEGTGEVVIDENGCILSQKYNLEASTAVNGVVASVRQSAECTNLAYDDAVESIVFPDFETDF